MKQLYRLEYKHDEKVDYIIVIYKTREEFLLRSSQVDSYQTIEEFLLSLDSVAIVSFFIFWLPT